MLINSYPKIHSIGHPQISELFNGEILLEEKVDGSAISWVVENQELFVRSKGVQLNVDVPEKLFSKAVEILKENINIFKSGVVYRGEYLSKKKHNCLNYDRVPKNNIIIYDIMTAPEAYVNYDEKKLEVERIGFEVVPLIYCGPGSKMSVNDLRDMMTKISCLGGVNIEGFVVKNYSKFTFDGKPMMGKYVSEIFKETNKVEWSKSNPTNKDILNLLIEEYRSKGRWNKALIHLKEKGSLTNSPKDIASLLKETQIDIEEECKEEIKEKLWNWAKSHIMRGAIKGLPEYYKEYLLNSQFIENKEKE